MHQIWPNIDHFVRKPNLKLDAVVFLDTVSKPIDFGFKRTRVRMQGPLACVLRDCRLVHDEEPLYLFMHGP